MKRIKKNIIKEGKTHQNDKIIINMYAYNRASTYIKDKTEFQEYNSLVRLNKFISKNGKSSVCVCVYTESICI